MADTCIVCLGDLAGAEANDVPAATELKLELPATACNSKHHDTTAQVQDPSETIAHLLPCGHDLHHECLKPWVERANSCPICRQSFNEVELKNNIYGPCISSYAVQEKRQVADIDPTLVVDDDLFEEPPTEPCIMCEGTEDEDVLLLCDGCNASCHTYCAGLESVPAGAWFCQFCHEDGTVHANAATRQRTRTTRTGAQRRRAASQREQSPDAWARVWQSVWSNLNLDLDFPFDEDTEAAERDRAHRREFNQWQRRFRVAERQGGAARFRDTAATLLDRRARTRGPTPQPESQDELRAWNAFDKARELSATNAFSTTRRKRPSPTASPVEPQPAATERALKRPRTRRTTELAERPLVHNADVPSSVQHGDGEESPPVSRPSNDPRSFFHSLLHEVETSPSTPNSSTSRDPFASNTAASPSYSESPSPQGSSPASPAMSNHSSPRSRSASPTRYSLSRPSSPPMVSSILPVFSHSPAALNGAFGTPLPPLPDQYVRHTERSHTRHSIVTSPTQPKATTTSKLDRVRSTKAELQAMVAAALKPAYQKKEIDKDQYTDINRDISRKLYDMVGEKGRLGGEAGREKWQSVANEEVVLAVNKLKELEAVGGPG